MYPRKQASNAASRIFIVRYNAIARILHLLITCRESVTENVCFHQMRKMYN